MKMKTPVLAALGLGIVGCSDGNDTASGREGIGERSFLLAEDMSRVSVDLAEDLALIGTARGWSLSEAHLRHLSLEAVGEVAAKVAAEEPDIFVGSVVSADPTEPPALLVKGPATDLVHRLVLGSTMPIRLIDNQPYSFDELEARKLTVHRALEGMGYLDIATSASIEAAGEIQATVALNANVLARSEADIVARLPEAIRRDVRIEFTDNAAFSRQASFGGMLIDSGVCTSGWSIQAPTPFGGTAPGIVTASHCTGINNINHPGHGAHPLTGMSGHLGQWGDVRWLATTSQPDEPTFYSNNTDIRNVTSVEARASITVGESICFYSRLQGIRNCSATVQNTSVACSVNGTAADRFVRMNSSITIAGDSGGGWSFSGRAFGIHTGICVNSIFSVADLLDEAFGGSVLIAP